MAIGQKNDVIVWQEGGRFFIRPLTARAARWCEDNIEDASWWGDSFYVEHRFLHALTRGMREDGLVVR